MLRGSRKAPASESGRYNCGCIVCSGGHGGAVPLRVLAARRLSLVAERDHRIYCGGAAGWDE
jgi:hypothetical protein